MSERRDIAERLAKFICENQLAQVYGGDVQQSDKRGKPYLIGFSVCRYLDGTVLVYSPKFINVSFQTAYRDLPERDHRVFTKVEDAENFLRLAFIEHNVDEALSIPVKQ